MAPKFVAPYRKSGKNDGNDAEAICEAVCRPNMRFVPIKSVQQQADLSVHRVRQGFVEERTATFNRVRGLIAEFGYVLPNGVEQLRRQVPQVIDRLPAQVARCVHDLLEHAERLRGGKVLEYEREIRVSIQDNELARRAHTRPGIGPITASALVATVGNGHDFKNGRQFSAIHTCAPCWSSAPAQCYSALTAKVIHVPLGARPAAASRLSQSLRGHRRQECPGRLGTAGQGG